MRAAHFRLEWSWKPGLARQIAVTGEEWSSGHSVPLITLGHPVEGIENKGFWSSVFLEIKISKKGC